MNLRDVTCTKCGRVEADLPATRLCGRCDYEAVTAERDALKARVAEAAEAESERDALRAHLADVEAILDGRPPTGVETPIVTKALLMVSAFAEHKEELAERDATIAVMREALEEVRADLRQYTTENDNQELLRRIRFGTGVAVDRALSPDAGRDKVAVDAERLAAMERVVEAHRKLRHGLDEPAGCGCVVCDALGALDAKEPR